ncbi:MAG: glycerol-3-phosphate dehydrogenase, partial [Devosiaceae bacterium]|nr:glycerol-3-phosphate dehydrogenase [Devosiaceae bacterium]
QSRNYSFGVQLGRGGTVDDILGMGIGLAEGVVTAPVALSLGRHSKTDVPLVASVNALLVQKQSVTQIVQDLMQRRLKAEGK